MQSEILHVDGQRKSFYVSASVAFGVVIGRSQTYFWQVFGKFLANIRWVVDKYCTNLWKVMAWLNSFALSILQSFARLQFFASNWVILSQLKSALSLKLLSTVESIPDEVL